MPEKHAPITTKNYYKWQVDEYKTVKKIHGETYAKKWFYAKHG